VKALPAFEVAVAIKPEGQADPGAIYDGLSVWIFKQGYAATEGPCEKFLSHATAGDYAQMKTEIMIPVTRILPHED